MNKLLSITYFVMTFCMCTMLWRIDLLDTKITEVTASINGLSQDRKQLFISTDPLIQLDKAYGEALEEKRITHKN